MESSGKLVKQKRKRGVEKTRNLLDGISFDDTDEKIKENWNNLLDGHQRKRGKYDLNSSSPIQSLPVNNLNSSSPIQTLPANNLNSASHAQTLSIINPNSSSPIQTLPVINPNSSSPIQTIANNESPQTNNNKSIIELPQTKRINTTLSSTSSPVSIQLTSPSLLTLPSPSPPLPYAATVSRAKDPCSLERHYTTTQKTNMRKLLEQSSLTEAEKQEWRTTERLCGIMNMCASLSKGSYRHKLFEDKITEERRRAFMSGVLKTQSNCKKD